MILFKNFLYLFQRSLPVAQLAGPGDPLPGVRPTLVTTCFRTWRRRICRDRSDLGAWVRAGAGV